MSDRRVEPENSRGTIVVRPEDAFRSYGKPNPPFGTLSIGDLKIEFVCHATPESPVAERGYEIVPKLVGYGEEAELEIRERNRIVFESGRLHVLKARPTVTVTGSTETYDGASHPAKASATGVFGEDLSGHGTFAFTYSTPDGNEPSDAGTHQVIATFTPNLWSNYEAETASGTIVIQPAQPNVTVMCESFTYDGCGHPATAKAVGINGQDISATGKFSFTYTPISTTAQGATTPVGSATIQAPANAATYMVSAVFTPGAQSNYSAKTGSGFLTILPAHPTLTINGGLAVYDGQEHPATASVTLAGKDISKSGKVTYTYAAIPSGQPVAAPKKPGAYAAVAYFTPDQNSNFSPASAASVTTIQMGVSADGAEGAVLKFQNAVAEANTQLTGAASKEATLQSLFQVARSVSHLIREIEERRGTLGSSEPHTRYEVTGQLVTAGQAPIVDFPVQIMNVNTNQIETTITNEQGIYEFWLKQGSYTVSARGQQIGTVTVPPLAN